MWEVRDRREEIEEEEMPTDWRLCCPALATKPGAVFLWGRKSVRFPRIEDWIYTDGKDVGSVR